MILTGFETCCHSLFLIAVILFGFTGVSDAQALCGGEGCIQLTLIVQPNQQ